MLYLYLTSTAKPVAKNLIEYNNNSEEKDEDEIVPIDIEFTEQKILTLDEQLYKEKTRKTLIRLI